MNPQLVEIMNVASSVCILFVWGCICLAYLRYYTWCVPRELPLNCANTGKQVEKGEAFA